MCQFFETEDMGIVCLEQMPIEYFGCGKANYYFLTVITNFILIGLLI